MTELLQHLIPEFDKLRDDEQNAIASRIFPEIEDERAWKIRLEAPTDDYWDRLGEIVRPEISTDDRPSAPEGR
ncbi:hypothetical protein JYQ62_05060 [Nostoc sp. UHCC 0702]|nr:hypothetical protein JYQ62_05060 [Nostoc sp. UHCC 0702]